jgi:hypothetical protein
MYSEPWYFIKYFLILSYHLQLVSPSTVVSFLHIFILCYEWIFHVPQACYILWRVRIAPPINVGSGSDDWILLAAHITTCLNYSHLYSAIAIPHIEQSLHTTIHTVSFQQSTSITAYSWNTQCNCRHSQLALTITLCNTLIHYTHWLTSIVFSLLHTHWLAHWHWLHNYLTDTDLLYCLNYTDSTIHYCTLYFSTVLLTVN